MLDRPQARAALVLVGLVAACGTAPPVVVTPPVVEAPTPPAVRARWVFPAGKRRVTAQMPLGVGSRLFVGLQGLRRVVREREAPLEAPTISLDDYLGVLKDDQGQFLFVAVNGDTFPVSEPLGALGPVRRGPLHRSTAKCAPSDGDECLSKEDHFAWLTTGQKALLGITQESRVMRSGDFGASWGEVSLPKGAGRAAAIELDPQGNGLLLRYPQELLVTHDDGVSWRPVVTPGIGAREVRRDGNDRLWLMGRSEAARLDGTALTATHEQPAPLDSGSDDVPGDGRSRTSGRTLLCDDRKVDVYEVSSGETRAIGFAATVLGDKAPKPAEHANLVGEGLTPLVGCYGAEMVYLRTNEEQEAAPRSSAVFRSHDWGATWTEDGQVFGIATREPSDVDVTLGPDGWTFIGELCPATDESECNHRQIRPAKASAFEDMAFTEEFAPQSFAFDRDHDRVYATGLRNGLLYLYESPLTQNHFSRVKLGNPLSSSGQVRSAMTVDASGTLRVLTRDDAKRAWALDKRPFGGEPQPTLYVPIGDGPVALVGNRGLILSEQGDGWETADGGDTWRKTGRIQAAALHCGAGGCIDDDGTQRVGWDAPVVTEGDVINAMSEPPGPPPSDGPRAAPPPNDPPIDLVCKASGTPTVVVSTPSADYVDSHGEARWWTNRRTPDGKTWIVFGARSGVREADLLPPAPKPPPPVGKVTVSYTTADRAVRDGFVAARYRTTMAAGVRQPVDVELAWWSATTGQTHRHELKKLPLFYVAPSNGSFSGYAQIVDGGLLFQTQAGREGYFIHDDGKVETVGVPSGFLLQATERVGKTWLGLDGVRGAAGLTWSSEGAKSWTRKDWTLEANGQTAIALLKPEGAGGAASPQPLLGYGHGSEVEAVFRVPPTPTPDPPAPILVKRGSPTLATCPLNAVFRDAALLPNARRSVHARILDGASGASGGKGAKVEALLGRMTSTWRVTRVLADGSVCVASEIVNGNDPRTNDAMTAFLYPEPKGFSGYWFHRVVDPKDKTKKATVASLLTCDRAPPEAKR